MPTYELARGKWRRYCDRLSREVAGRSVELDVTSLDLGDHVEARWLPLLGIVFDARADVLEIALVGVGHSIRGPREIHLEETERGLVSLAIVSANETVETLRFRAPLRLPPPDAAPLERCERRRRSGDES
jgi:hypothetical protein